MSNNYNHASGFLQVVEGEADGSQTQSQLQSLGVTPQPMRNSERVTDNFEINQNVVNDDNQERINNDSSQLLEATNEEPNDAENEEEQPAGSNERYGEDQYESPQE